MFFSPPLLLDNLKSGPPMPDCGSYLVFGFTVLRVCLANHVHIPEIYLLVSELFLATPHCEPLEAAKVRPLQRPVGLNESLPGTLAGGTLLCSLVFLNGFSVMAPTGLERERQPSNVHPGKHEHLG